jgi:polyphosphate kinase 2
MPQIEIPDWQDLQRPGVRLDSANSWLALKPWRLFYDEAKEDTQIFLYPKGIGDSEGEAMSEKASSSSEHAQPVRPLPSGSNGRSGVADGKVPKPLRLGKDCAYDQELLRLSIELVKLQEWIKHKGLRVVILFEGRDAAGKGGTISRIAQTLNPRVCHVVALGTPTEREKSQWYFQRYVAHLPAAGEMVLFDRSWYNRAGVERVMGFCSEAEYLEFMHSCPEFERMLIRSGLILIKYWFSVSDEEQERRFQDRMKDPTKRWKLSMMDLESRRRWAEYSRAKDEMFAVTDTKQSPWYVVDAENKKCARLNVIHHLLSMIPYEDLTPKPLKLPPLDKTKYVRPPIHEQTFVPEVYRRQ